MKNENRLPMDMSCVVTPSEVYGVGFQVSRCLDPKDEIFDFRTARTGERFICLNGPVETEGVMVSIDRGPRFIVRPRQRTKRIVMYNIPEPEEFVKSIKIKTSGPPAPEMFVEELDYDGSRTWRRVD
jgi:hypothetical protein